MDEIQALKRFSRQIKYAARLTVRTFRPSVPLEDAMQEASVLVITYAGLMPGRHSGKLAQIEHDAEGDERRVQAILSAQLAKDMYQIFGRLTAKQETFTSLDNLPPRFQPNENPEDHWIAGIDHDRYIREQYPYLYMHAIENLTLDEVAKRTGEGTATVDRRIAVEKRRAAHDEYFVLQDDVKAAYLLAA